MPCPVICCPRMLIIDCSFSFASKCMHYGSQVALHVEFSLLLKNKPSLFGIMIWLFIQAKSPLRTLDELHVCEMPVWPCFPSAQERRRSLLNTKADISDITTASKQPDSRMNFGSSEQLRCFVFTARARSFLYHQVRFKINHFEISSTKP